MKKEFEIDDKVYNEFRESIKKGSEESIINSMISVLLEVSDSLVDEVVFNSYDKDGDKWNDISEMLLIKLNCDIR